jgi:hypothetical protein
VKHGAVKQVYQSEMVNQEQQTVADPGIEACRGEHLRDFSIAEMQVYITT